MIPALLRSDLNPDTALTKNKIGGNQGKCKQRICCQISGALGRKLFSHCFPCFRHLSIPKITPVCNVNNSPPPTRGPTLTTPHAWWQWAEIRVNPRISSRLKSKHESAGCKNNYYVFVFQGVMVKNTSIVLSTLREVLFSWNTGIGQQPFSWILKRQVYSSNQVARWLSAQCWKYKLIRNKHFANISKNFLFASWSSTMTEATNVIWVVPKWA